VTIQVKKGEKYIDVAKNITGGKDTTSYKWTPKDFATGFGYRLVIFDTAVGIRGTPPSGGAKGVLSIEFGINSDDNNNGGMYNVHVFIMSCLTYHFGKTCTAMKVTLSLLEC
jgi:hypothetical protein